MLIKPDGSVHFADGLAFDRTTKTAALLELPQFRGIIDRFGNGAMDSTGFILDENGRKFSVTLSFEDGTLNEIVLYPVLEDAPPGGKAKELRRKTESDRILAHLFGAPDSTSEFRTEYALDHALVYTWVNWNPRCCDGGGICILYL